MALAELLTPSKNMRCFSNIRRLFSSASSSDSAMSKSIFKANAAPVGSPWMWTLIFPHHEDRTPTHGYVESREAAMAAFAKSWRRE
jgi:hypothetical protein